MFLALNSLYSAHVCGDSQFAVLVCSKKRHPVMVPTADAVTCWKAEEQAYLSGCVVSHGNDIPCRRNERGVMDHHYPVLALLVQPTCLPKVDTTKKLNSHGPLSGFKRGEIGKTPLVPTAYYSRLRVEVNSGRANHPLMAHQLMAHLLSPGAPGVL